MVNVVWGILAFRVHVSECLHSLLAFSLLSSAQSQIANMSDQNWREVWSVKHLVLATQPVGEKIAPVLLTLNLYPNSRKGRPAMSACSIRWVWLCLPRIWQYVPRHVHRERFSVAVFVSMVCLYGRFGTASISRGTVWDI